MGTWANSDPADGTKHHGRQVRFSQKEGRRKEGRLPDAGTAHSAPYIHIYPSRPSVRPPQPPRVSALAPSPLDSRRAAIALAIAAYTYLDIHMGAGV